MAEEFVRKDVRKALCDDRLSLWMVTLGGAPKVSGDILVVDLGKLEHQLSYEGRQDDLLLQAIGEGEDENIHTAQSGDMRADTQKLLWRASKRRGGRERPFS